MFASLRSVLRNYETLRRLFSKTSSGRGENVPPCRMGRAKEGKVLASAIYGCRTVPGKPSEREIDPEQTKIVERIFMEHIAGNSPPIDRDAPERGRRPPR